MNLCKGKPAVDAVVANSGTCPGYEPHSDRSSQACGHASKDTARNAEEVSSASLLRLELGLNGKRVA
eukprot:9205678-Alexandrium_andersonii.AAC.1